MESSSVTPLEPEVRVLSRLARIGLLGVRGVLSLVGSAAIAGAVAVVIDPLLIYSTAADVPAFGELVARSLVFVCMGLPLVLPVAWTFGRGRWLVLGLALLLIAVPMAFEIDPACFLIRAFACLVGLAAIVIWRLLWQLRSA